MNKKELKNIEDKKYFFILLVGLAVLKSFVEAIFMYAWGIASILLLSGLIVYFKQDITIIKPFLEICLWFMQNYTLVLAVLFFWEYYINLKKVFNKNGE